jgi:hypothetical protein
MLPVSLPDAAAVVVVTPVALNFESAPATGTCEGCRLRP